jgi:hypothetical protein
VRVSGRRAAGRVSECSLWLPAGSGAVENAGDEPARAGLERRGPVGAGPGDGPEAA